MLQIFNHIATSLFYNRLASFNAKFYLCRISYSTCKYQSDYEISIYGMSRIIFLYQITMVVNYDLPVDQKGQVDFETYLHRIGRTGRFGKSGLAINFVDGHRSFSHLQKIESHFGKKIEQLKAEDVEEIEEAVGDSQ